MCVINVQEINSCMTSNKCPNSKMSSSMQKKKERKQFHDDDHTDSYRNLSLPFAAPCS